MNIPFEEIESGVPFLTVNKRLARTVQSRFDQTMKERGLKVWNSPSIIPFLSWLHELWTSASREKFLLSPIRSLILWENIIASDHLFLKESLLSGREVAGTAYDAYKLIKEYKLDINNDLFCATEESRIIKRWAMLYEKKLNDLNFMDSCQLPVYLTHILNNQDIQVPPKVILAGYDEISPLFSDLLAALQSSGCQVAFWQPLSDKTNPIISKPDSLKKITFTRSTDESDEVKNAAKWIRETYRQGVKIGVLVPDLRRYREKIIAAFKEELDPLSIFPWQKEEDIVNISLGSSLYDEAIVRSAIEVLGMDEKQRGIDEISAFLLSPYLTPSKEELIRLASLDVKLRRKNHFTLTIRDIWKSLKSEKATAPAFMSALEHLLWDLQEKKPSMLPGEWSKSFSKLLRDMNWPANSSKLSSLEYQALQSFGEILSSLASLDDITGPVDKKEALKYLKKMANETIFHGESKESPIAVMGLLESGGMSFDEIWFLGAHDGLLPGQPSPNPFIPFKLQKDHNMPKSTFNRELDFSKTHLQRILSSTESIIFSYPERVDDREVNVSPLISHLQHNISANHLGPSHSLIVTMESLLTETENENLDGLELEESEILRGGTSILKNQSDCPFRAFAIHRLNAVRPEDPEPGISAMERGSVIHRALEFFWKHVQDDRRLRELEESGKLDQIISDSAREGLNLLNFGEAKGTRFQKIELERLSSLLREWLLTELRRGNFTAAESESEKNIHIGGLKLSSRIDRIDTINGNSKAIIDYKTGSVSTADWTSSRPKEPQLMLYASSGNYDAVLFAKLKRNDCRFTGIAKEEGLFPGIKAFEYDPFIKKMANIRSWNELMEHWKSTLSDLARDFQKGRAHIDPRDNSKESSDCKYCQHYLMCRIFEQSEIQQKV